MKICYLGSGCWGFCLASLLARKGYSVKVWTVFPELADTLNKTKEHPRIPDFRATGDLTVTTSLEEALQDADMIVESVTAAGIRDVFTQLKKIGVPKVPIVLTSKGIEQGTGLPLSQVILEILGDEVKNQLGAVSGPSYATEVIHGLPTSVVGSGYDEKVMHLICDTFTTKNFRVYPNSDMLGISYGGALKNVVAIACGIAEGLSLGNSARAALMTRGLHEMRKLATAKGANQETLYGLSGMGDLCVTCSSMISRNFRFGYLLAAEKLSPEEAAEKIGMVIEGAYTAVSALELSRELSIPMPITETVYQILHEGLKPRDAVSQLMKRAVKKEHL